MPENNPSLDIERLQATLEHKEQVILALTERLGETAEHLDRLRRMGMDKIRPGSGGGGSGSVPRELIESQEQLAERMNGFVDRWDEHQTFDRILKIEEKIDEILSTVRSSGARPAAASAASAGRMESRPEKRQEPAPAPAQQAPAEPAMSPWDALKAKLMQQDGAAAPEKPAAPAPATPPEQKPVEYQVAERIEARGGGKGPVEAEAEFELMAPPPPPEPVAINAPTSVMRDAIDRRDAYIAFLMNRLRYAELKRYEPINWEVVAQAPEDLASRVKELAETLDDQLKKFEIAQSLERASLTRERSRLQQIKQQLENEILGLGAAGPGKQRDPNKASAEEARLAKLIGKKK